MALIGFTAMGGAIGSGGLGDLAFRDGYQRSHTDVALVTVVLLLVLVQLLQMLGDRLVAHTAASNRMPGGSGGSRPAAGSTRLPGKTVCRPLAGNSTCGQRAFGTS